MTEGVWYLPLISGVGLWGAKRSIMNFFGIQRSIDIVLSLVKLTLLMEATETSFMDSFGFFFENHSSVGLYLDRHTIFGYDSWLQFALVVSLVHDFLEYGGWRTFKYYSHWMAILLCSYSQGFQNLPMALYRSLAAFELVNLMLLSLPASALLFKTTAFGLVRVIAFAVLTGSIFHGQWILSAALAMQGIMFYEMAEKSYELLF